METAIVKSEAEVPQAPAAEKRLTVFARNPQEMNVAQGQLIKWTLGKLGEIRGEIDDLQENLDIATKNGWRTATLKRQIGRAKGRVEFYRKVKAALEAGYCIVPNFPVDVFAVRTERQNPKDNAASTTGGWTPRVQAQRSESPVLGEGDWKSPDALTTTDQENVTENGKTLVRTTVTAWAFQDVDFPFAFAQPAVLDATQQAMVDRVFDELGVSPATAVRRSRGDPMVIGRIYAPHSRYNRETQALSFVVAWFLRPDRDLDF